MTNRSAPLGTIVPILKYRDVPKAIEWLATAFGFTERLRTPPGPDGTIHHAQVAIGAGSIILSGQPAKDPGPHPKASLFVSITDLDAHCERARQAGARIVNQPRTCEFGERQYTAEDLEGHVWTFSQSVADVDPRDWGALVSK